MKRKVSGKKKVVFQNIANKKRRRSLVSKRKHKYGSEKPLISNKDNNGIEEAVERVSRNFWGKKVFGKLKNIF